VSTGEFASISRLPKFDRAAASAALCRSEIVVALEIEPKLRLVEAEILPQANGSIRADGSVPADDLMDARKTQRLCQRISAHSRGLHEFGLENFSPLDRKHLL
jgi:hypothetical protein